MKCVGDFVFKSLEKRSAGEFRNDKGSVVKYDESYILKVDEQAENGIFERKFKVSVQNTDLIHNLQALQPYSKCKIGFDVHIFNNQIRLIPLELLDDDYEVAN